MGCDIHAHVEVKLAGVWHHYTPVDFSRNYRLFAFMADVKNYDNEIKPLADPRGLPEDVSPVTALASARYGIDGHSHSWLSYDEMLKVVEFASENRGSMKPWWADQYGPVFGAYLFGNYMTGWKEYPNDYPAELEDIRLVFWFDN